MAKKFGVIALYLENVYICRWKSENMSARKLEIINLIKQLGEEVLPKDARVLLYGSQARNDARPDSDWDLLILLEGERVSGDDFNNMVFPFISLGWSLGVEINTVVYTYGQWQQRHITPFYKNVMREGIKIC